MIGKDVERFMFKGCVFVTGCEEDDIKDYGLYEWTNVEKDFEKEGLTYGL